MKEKLVKAISIYRGQSNGGLGEGMENPISFGEQFLDEVDRDSKSPLHGYNELTKDETILNQVRPWMTLDSSPADHQRLTDQLEGWTLFSLDDYFCVVRLTAAGKFDRRAAYFAHGYFWKKEECDGSFDPGMYLGWSDGFDQPWRTGEPCKKLASNAYPSSTRYLEHANTPSSKSFLAHFYHALEKGYPLLIAVPLKDFQAGSSLYSELSFARAALPTHLKLNCTMQIYSRSPENLLRRRLPDITVIPEDVASDALRVVNKGVLLDRGGAVKFSSQDDALPEKYSLYSDLVIENFEKNPETLLRFCQLFSNFLQEDSKNKTSSSVEELVHSSFTYAQISTEKDINWGALIKKEILDKENFNNISPRFIWWLEQQNFTVDSYLEEWCKEPNEKKMDLILELFIQKPLLVSSRIVTGLCQSIPVSRLFEKKQIVTILGIALKGGDTQRWGEEPDKLSDLAQEDLELRYKLLDSTIKGNLDPKWMDVLLGKLSDEKAGQFMREILEQKKSVPNWYKILQPPLKEIRNRKIRDRGLFLLIEEKENNIPIAPNEDRLRAYLLMTDILGLSENPLLDTLMLQLSSMDKKYQQASIKALHENKWTNLTSEILFKDGQFQFDWLYDHPDLLLSEKYKDIINSLTTKTLLKIWQTLNDERNAKKILIELDKRIERKTEETTAILIKTDYWFSWRQTTLLKNNLNKMKTFSFAWFTSKVWSDTTWINTKSFDITRETWKQVIKDLDADWSNADLKKISTQIAAQHCPWITPFKIDQVKDICSLISNSESIAMLADAFSKDNQIAPFLSPSPKKFVFYHSPKIKNVLESLFANAATSLNQGDSTNKCWKNIDELMGDTDFITFAEHPLITLANKICNSTDKYPDLEKPGWDTMKNVIANNNDGMYLESNEKLLPIFHLATSLTNSGNLLSLGRDIISLLPTLRLDKDWLAALFRSADEIRRKGGVKSCDDRQELITWDCLEDIVPENIYFGALEELDEKNSDYSRIYFLEEVY